MFYIIFLSYRVFLKKSPERFLKHCCHGFFSYPGRFQVEKISTKKRPSSSAFLTAEREFASQLKLCLKFFIREKQKW